MDDDLRDMLYHLDAGYENDMRQRIKRLEMSIASLWMNQKIPQDELFVDVDDRGNHGVTTLASLIQSNSWHSAGDSLLSEDGYHYVTAVKYNSLDGCIYLGGSWNEIGDVSTNGIAKYDPSTGEFSALGAGYDGCVAIAIDPSGNIYFGGASGVKKWNGSSLTTLSGLTGQVLALACDSDGNLYAGGTFTNAGGDSNADLFAVFDGAAWSACGTAFAGASGTVYALDIDAQDQVYIGMSCVNIGGANGDYCVMWDGSAYNALGTGPGGAALGLDIGKDAKVYVVIRATPDQVKCWDPTTSSWSTLGTSPITGVYYGYLRSICVDANDQVYIFGQSQPDVFESAYRWDGLEWHALHLSDASLYCSDADADNNIWVGGHVEGGLLNYFGYYGTVALQDVLDYLHVRIADNSFPLGANNLGLVVGTLYASAMGGTSLTTETAVEFTVPFDILVDQLGVLTSTSQSASFGMTVTVRKNNANTDLTISIVAGSAAGTFEDLQNSAVFLRGDKIAIQCANSGGISANIRAVYMAGRKVRL